MPVRQAVWVTGWAHVCSCGLPALVGSLVTTMTSRREGLGGVALNIDPKTSSGRALPVKGFL